MQYLNAPIELYEIENVVSKLKIKKAVGIDKIPNEILKNPNMLKHRHKLLQEVLDKGIVPSQWKIAIITPPYTPLNYREISLNSCLAKVFFQF